MRRFIPESPRWLMRNHKLEETYEVLQLIAKINKTENVDICVLKNVASLEINETDSSKVIKMSFLDFFRNKDLRILTLSLLTIWSSWAIIFFGIGYDMKNIGGNPYINVMLLGIADALAYPAAFFACNS